MSEWYPIFKYGLIAGLPAAVMFFYGIRILPTIVRIIVIPLVILVALPALLAPVLRADEQLAVFVGLLAGYVIAFTGRYLRRGWLRRDIDDAAVRTTRPWQSLPEEARHGLRAPGDLGDYGAEDDHPPLRFIGNR